MFNYKMKEMLKDQERRLLDWLPMFRIDYGR